MQHHQTQAIYPRLIKRHSRKRNSGDFTARNTTTSTYYVFADQIDTPRAISNANGSIVWKWEGEGFGMVQPNEDPDGDGTGSPTTCASPGSATTRSQGCLLNVASLMIV